MKVHNKMIKVLIIVTLIVVNYRFYLQNYHRINKNRKNQKIKRNRSYNNNYKKIKMIYNLYKMKKVNLKLYQMKFKLQMIQKYNNPNMYSEKLIDCNPMMEKVY